MIFKQWLVYQADWGSECGFLSLSKQFEGLWESTVGSGPMEGKALCGIWKESSLASPASSQLGLVGICRMPGTSMLAVLPEEAAV